MLTPDATSRMHADTSATHTTPKTPWHVPASHGLECYSGKRQSCSSQQSLLSKQKQDRGAHLLRLLGPCCNATAAAAPSYRCRTEEHCHSQVWVNGCVVGQGGSQQLPHGVQGLLLVLLQEAAEVC